MRPSVCRLAVVWAALVAAGAPAVLAREPLKIGEIRAYRAETPHPYPFGAERRPVVWNDTIVSPGAAFLKVHFARLDLAPGDYLTVSNSTRTQVHTYTGRGPKGTGDVWAFAIDGDTALIELHGGGARGYGYLIDSVGHGTVPLTVVPEATLCSPDGKEDVACHTREKRFDTAQRTVALLIMTVPQFGSMIMCTGFLIAGINDSTAMTAGHCLDGQEMVDTLEARFNFQFTRCGGTTPEPTSSFAGDRFLHRSQIVPHIRPGENGLDYTIFTLLGSPEATWGELVPSLGPYAVGDLTWVIGHPNVLPKRVSYWEDPEMTVRCMLTAVDQSDDSVAPQSQAEFDCDVEGGNSGSPLVDAATGRVLAIVNSVLFGGTAPGTEVCTSQGSEMRAVCADAGGLLSCVPD